MVNNNVQQMILDLEKVLEIKSFSESVKQRIKQVLVMAWEIEEDKQIIFDIIYGLRDIDVFEINTKTELLKNKDINSHILDHCLGYVSDYQKSVIIVKNENIYSTIYHELVHLTQSEDSYYIPHGYPFSEILQKALREGEAVEHENKFLKKYFPNEIISIDKILLDDSNTNSILYRIFHEIYNDMKLLLSSDLLEELKQNKNEDLIPKIDKYIDKNYNTNFPFLYSLWISISYRYADMFEEDKIKIQNLGLQKELFELCLKDNKSSIDNIIKSIEYDKRTIRQLASEKREYQIALSSDENLQNYFEKILCKRRKKLNEYIKQKGLDDFSIEWEQEINNTNLIDFKNNMLLVLEGIKKKIKNIGKALAQKQSDLCLLKYQKRYYEYIDLNLDLFEMTIMKNNLLQEINNNKISNSLYYAYIFSDKESQSNKYLLYKQ